MLVLDLDWETTVHLALALKSHKYSLRRNGQDEPRGFTELEEHVAEIVRRRQHAPAGAVPDKTPSYALRELEYLDRRQAGAIAGVSTRTIDRWLADGRLRSERIGGVRRIARADLDDCLRGNRVAA